MEEKKSNCFKQYIKSIVNNKTLFELRKKTVLIPILIFMLIVILLAVPSYLFSKSVDKNSIIKSFPEIEKPLEKILTSNLDCHVKNGILTCSEETPSLNTVIGDDIKYTIIVNQKTIALDTEVVYSKPKDSDNLIILYTQTIRIRYVQRDLVNETVKVYEIIGDYSEFENFSLKETSNKISNDPSILSSEIKNFVYTTYKSTLDTKLIVKLSSSILSFALLVIVSCLVIKGRLRFKKGFKFIECFKISMLATLPCIIISGFLSLIIGINNASSFFGLMFVGRIMFIYFKYIFNNKIFKELYESEKNERFNF